MNYVIGVDVGGTFTDVVCLDEKGQVTISKTPSTPSDPSIGIMTGLSKVADNLGTAFHPFLKKTTRITHGTTVSTNTVLTWTGAKVGLLCTKGFRDILGTRFGIRENPYNFTIPQPDTLCPRYLRVPIEERIDANGSEVVSLNETDVIRACEYFLEQGVEAVAICFLWSFKNSDHERQALALCREKMPDTYVCASCDIQPEIREYWRMSTTVINAYVGPKLSSYLKHLQQALNKEGFEGQLLVTQSNSGVIYPEVAMEQAVRTVLSGPACAPAAAAHVGKSFELKDVITVDMGGTSFDVCLIKDGKPVTALESAIGGIYHMKLPLVDVRTIGTGGGSIAWIDNMNILHMGPQSAGASPGPACYGKGGTEPTCTDADLVLGYLNPEYYLGGEMRLHPKLAHQAIKEKIADPLGMEVTQAAFAMRRIIDHHMVDGISIVSVQRGEDPGNYTLVVAGGAGAVHAASLARGIGIRRLLIPNTSSVFCALGGVIADVRHDLVASVTTRSQNANLSQLNETFAGMRQQGHLYLEREGVKPNDRYFRYTIDMRYKGQYHELEVIVPPTALSEAGALKGKEAFEAIIEEFHHMHETLYSYRDTAEIEILNLRVAACGRVHTPGIKEEFFVGKEATAHQKGNRAVFFEKVNDFIDTPVYDGDRMEVGNEVKGPAIIELSTTTIVVPPKGRLEVTPYHSFMVDI